MALVAQRPPQQADFGLKLGGDEHGVPQGPLGILGESLGPANGPRRKADDRLEGLLPVREDLAVVSMKLSADESTVLFIEALSLGGLIYPRDVLTFDEKSRVEASDFSKVVSGGLLLPRDESVKVQVSASTIVGWVIGKIIIEAPVVAFLVA